jgi:N4-gp56 family major capsid protein
MGITVTGVNDPKAVRKYSAFLANDTPKKSYFTSRFSGKGAESSTPVQILTQLENEAGDKITYDLSLQMAMEPVEGDDILEGNEEDLKFASDEILIDQMRCGVNTGGKMSRKRTVHDYRKIARKRQSEWWARCFDELHFMYGSGARGVNDDFLFRSSYAGFAGNAFAAPDADHIIYGNSAGTKGAMIASDVMTLALIDKAVAVSEMMGGGVEQTPALQKIMVDGGEHYVLVMNPWQAHDLRTATGDGKWLDIQKAAAAAEGKSSAIFNGNLGLYNDVVLHKHKNVIRFNDYGSGAVKAARALFMGAQAIEVAYGSANGETRYGWNEETRDNGNQVVITSSCILGLKKTRFNNKDFGMMALDTAAKDPRT